MFVIFIFGTNSTKAPRIKNILNTYEATS